MGSVRVCNGGDGSNRRSRTFVSWESVECGRLLIAGSDVIIGADITVDEVWVAVYLASSLENEDFEQEGITVHDVFAVRWCRVTSNL